MAERGITEEDVRMALARATGGFRPGNKPGTMVKMGYAMNGKLLKVVVSAADLGVFISAFWKDET
ncbi:MAG: DUF4258 domain-containing protein [Acidobacteria bacterium]|nr:DUF4258 domain-containing protein [Verrucomicrobiota bacterium]MBW8824838.1 DUF4258 domain-containing protein [Acidobacteriota bacterium]